MDDVHDQLDQIADLYLTGPIRHAPATEAALTIEILLTGHLPVRAGLWLNQYASQAARTGGPAGLVRLDDEAVTLELVGSKDASARQAIRSARSLPQALGRLGALTANCMIAPLASRQWEEFVIAEPERLTMLCGADDAAIVAAYRDLKRIAEAARRLEVAVPEITLIIVGSPPQAARDAFERLQRTNTAQLGLDIRLGEPIPAMTPGQPTTSQRFPMTNPPMPATIVELLRGDPEQSTGLSRDPYLTRLDEIDGPAFDETEDGDSSELEATPAAATAEQSGVDHEQAFPKMIRMRPRMVSPGPAAARATPGTKPGATPGAKPEPPTAGSATVPHRQPEAVATDVDPVQFLDGLTKLPISCPSAPGVACAIDGSGSLHLVTGPEHLGDLLIASQWVRAHRDLLVAATPGLRFDATTEPLMHIVTNDPLRVSTLHGLKLHLHLATPVTVGADTTWYVTRLNQPE